MKTNKVLKERVQKCIKNHPDASLKKIVDSFVEIGCSRRSVYRWANSALQNRKVGRNTRVGPPLRIATKGTIQKVKRYFDHRTGRSQRKIAGKIGCSQAYISRLIKKHTDIRCYKKSKRPLMTDKQKQQARPKCRKMYYRYRGTDFVLDDEAYFPLSHNNLPGNDRFYSSDRSETPDEVKYDHKAKFAPKLLVWLAISPKGVSKPYFCPSGLAINQNVYLDIIKNNLKPFLLSNYRQSG